jgi:hypothetical protein
VLASRLDPETNCVCDGLAHTSITMTRIETRATTNVKATR